MAWANIILRKQVCAYNLMAIKTDSSTNIESIRRKYNQFVATESMEDFALRYSPAEFRKWSEFLVANTAIGSISFLALEAIGATIAINYGFQNAFWGILTASIIIFLMGFPICYYAAKYNIDIDLLTRAAGFGYLGSTFTSLIYASFCFIFFALEAAIMAQALLLYTGIPLSIGYAISSIVILPIVFYGMTAIHRLQKYTQFVWLFLMILPFILILTKEPQLLHAFFHFKGSVNNSSEFSFYYFGFAIGISLSLIAQIGEQVDYLRFMPDKTRENRIKWWTAVIFAGPGWIILGFFKQIGGMLLAALVLLGGASLMEAREPIHMYNIAYEYVFDNPEIALSVSFFFVILSQIKINVTNAYAGSLAWSNFFSRITHAHPGRVIWVVFNIAIALLLMELGVFEILESILGLYSNIAIAWIATIVADLVINKPLGLSPPLIEFKRAYLFNFNPVGIFSSLIASVISLIAFSGLLGNMAQAFSAIIALVVALFCSPLIAWLTHGKYYIAREKTGFNAQSTYICGVCGMTYDTRDMAECSLYNTNICSLCCSLESRCHDCCKNKPEFSLKKKSVQFLQALFKTHIDSAFLNRLAGFFWVLLSLLTGLGFVLWTTYIIRASSFSPIELEAIQSSYINLFFILSMISLVAAWLIVLMHENREFVETELTIKNLALEESQNTLARAQAVAHLGNWKLDLINNHLSWSEEVFRIFEIDPNQFAASYEAFLERIHPEDRKWVTRAFSDSVLNKQSYDIEHRLLMSDGRVKYVNERGETLYDVEGNPIESLGTVLDLTELKNAQKIIEHQAHFDNLTELPNRFLSLDRLTQLLKDAQRNRHVVAVLFLDLDDFKKVNDTLGHDTGDKLLIETARRLQGIVRSEDTVGRLGGDEFIVLLGELSCASDAQPVAENIVQVLQQAFHINNRELIMTVSIGIAIYPDDGTDTLTLLKSSDSAMYHAKDLGRNTYSYFTQEMNHQTSRRLELEEQIHGALERNEFEVYYQPKIKIETRRIIGAEALLRWHNHKLGPISPAEFITIAEQTGLIVPIGEFVLTEALNKVAHWQSSYYSDFHIAVNLSPRQFRDPELVNRIEKLLQNSGVPRQTLELEITEGVLLSGHGFIKQALIRLNKLGISLAMDDFGTGYSSLSYLRSYPFNVLKIDQSFVRDITTDHADRELINAAIAMAHALKLKVVAEGVETEGQLESLTQLKCDYAQGYFFSKPISVLEMEQLLQTL